MKMKEFGSGGGASLALPLDPPMSMASVARSSAIHLFIIQYSKRVCLAASTYCPCVEYVPPWLQHYFEVWSFVLVLSINGTQLTFFWVDIFSDSPNSTKSNHHYPKSFRVFRVKTLDKKSILNQKIRKMAMLWKVSDFCSCLNIVKFIKWNYQAPWIEKIRMVFSITFGRTVNLFIIFKK